MQQWALRWFNDWLPDSWATLDYRAYQTGVSLLILVVGTTAALLWIMLPDTLLSWCLWFGFLGIGIYAIWRFEFRHLVAEVRRVKMANGWDPPAHWYGQWRPI